jgi:hypothetical protein
MVQPQHSLLMGCSALTTTTTTTMQADAKEGFVKLVDWVRQ